eukprot:366217-Chlamydomonas_euryale.AAC.23
MPACAPHHRAVVAWVLNFGRAAIVRGAADAAHVVVAASPCPLCDAVPMLDRDAEAHAASPTHTARKADAADGTWHTRCTASRPC